MAQTDHFSFEFRTPAMQIERAVAEFRFGRPVVLEDRSNRIAALALDCAAPQTYDQFASVSDNRHCLFLSAPRAARLGISSRDGIAVKLDSMSFDEASKLSYAMDATAPLTWRDASPVMAAAAALARTALLLPSIVCVDIENDTSFAACQTLDCAHLDKSTEVRQNFEQVARTRVPLKDLGDADFVIFRGGLAQRDQIAILVGNPDMTKPVPVRIHSSCITGDLCGSLKCDCGDQLHKGLAALKSSGGGVFLYLDQEGRGTGIGAKMRAYGYQHLGLDTIDADAELGFEDDHRRYEAAVVMLRMLGVESAILHTNNPTKIAALRDAGIKVDTHAPVLGEITIDNLNYLRTKALRAGHILDINTLFAGE